MIVKNNTQSTDVWCGQSIASGATYAIQQNEIVTWRADDDVILDLMSGDLGISIDGGTSWITPGSTSVNVLLGVDITPKDPAGRPVMRSAATIDGWHYQLLSCEAQTSALGGYYCRDSADQDLGFVTYKIYDDQDQQITDAQYENTAVRTEIDVCPTHSYEIIGAIFAQATAPSTDVRLWVTGLPGIANVKFGSGGINLKHIGTGAIQLADGRASKYLAYNAQAPLASTMRIIIRHGAGVQHSFMLSFEVFRSP